MKRVRINRTIAGLAVLTAVIAALAVIGGGAASSLAAATAPAKEGPTTSTPPSTSTGPTAAIWVTNPVGKDRTDPDSKKAPVIRIGQGREGVIPLAVRLSGNSDSDGTVVVTVTLPKGLTFVRSETVEHKLAKMDKEFACANASGTLTCTLVRTSDGTTPARLKHDHTLNLDLVVRAAKGLLPVSKEQPDDPSTPDPTQPYPLGDFTAALSVPAGGTTLSATTSAPVQALSGYVPPQMRVFLDNLTFTTNPRSMIVRVRNLGGITAAPHGSVHAIQLTDVLPVEMQEAVYTAHGVGWTCAAGPDGRLRCYTDRPVPVGASAPDLKVTWRPYSDPRRITGQVLAWKITGKAGWNATTTPNGKKISRGGANCFSLPVKWNLKHLKPATLVAHVLTAKGVTVKQGGSTVMRVRVRNTGQAAALDPGVLLRAPPGVTLSPLSSAWTCTAVHGQLRCVQKAGLIEAGTADEFDIRITTTTATPAARGTVSVTPFAINDAEPAADRAPLAILDRGDPLITPRLQYKRDGHTWTPWTDGGRTKVEVGQALTYRVQLVNRGGDTLAAGSTVAVTERIGKGVKLISAGTDQSGSCASGAPVSCTLRIADAVAPGEVVGTIDITVLPQTVAKDADLGPIVARLVGTPGDERVPVRLRVTASDKTIRISTSMPRIPDSGGTGVMTMTATNLQHDAAIRRLQVTTTLPEGVQLVSATGSVWTCRAAGQAITCAFPATLPRRTRTPKATFEIRAIGNRRVASTVWNATAVSVGSGHRELGITRTKLPVRGAITVSASASPSVVMATRKAGALHTVVLRGSKSAGNGVSLDYAWTQRCTTAADVAAYGKCPGAVAVAPVRIEHPNAATARALIPNATKRTVYTFQLTVTDHSSTKTQIVSVTAAPAQKLKQGGEGASSGQTTDALSKRQAQAKAQKAAEADRRKRASSATSQARATQQANASKGRTVVRGAPTVTIDGGSLQNAKPGADVTLRATARGTGRLAYAWSQAGGPTATIDGRDTETAKVHLPSTPGLASFAVVVTDESGRTGSARVTVSIGTNAQPTDTTQALTASIIGAPALSAVPGTAVTLTALALGGTGTAKYAWSQTGGPSVALRTSAGAVTGFTMPSTGETLSFRVTATDASGARSTAEATVSTQAKPPEVSVAGGPLIAAAAKTEVRLPVQVSGGNGALRYRWAQVSGAKVAIKDGTTDTATITTPAANGLLVFTVTATDDTGAQSTGTVTVSVGATTGKAYCAFLKQTAKAAGGGKLNLPLGSGVSASFGTITPPSPTALSACSSSSTRQSTVPAGATPFSSSSFAIGQVTIANASGYVLPAGIEITTGTVTTPASWQLPVIAIGSTPLSLAFTGPGNANALLSGSVTAQAFPFLTLPSGFTGTTTLTFTPDGTTTTGTVNATATNGSGQASVTGSLSTSGTFSASVTSTHLITIGTSTIDLSGSVTNASGSTVADVSGSSTGAIALAPGVALSSASVNWTTADSGPVLTGSATVALSTGSASPTALDANLSYTDPTNWTATLTGSGGPAWKPLNGLSISPSDFSGSVAQANGAWQWDITAKVPTWQAAPAMSLTNTTLSLSSTCTASTGITCPQSMVFFNVATTAVVDPPLSDPISVSADAVFGLGGSPSFSLAATLSGAITAIPGVNLSITNATVAVNDVSGTSLSPTLTMPQGSISLPSGWRLPTIQLPKTPLSLVFITSGGGTSSGGSSSSGGSGSSSTTIAQLLGTINVPSFPFLTLPTGWSGTAGIQFGPTAGVYGSATASASDGSHDVTVTGTINQNGTFSASVDAQDIVTVGSTSFNVAGTVSNTSGQTVSTVTGSIGSPAPLVSGVTLTTLSATWTPNTSGPLFTGSATVAINSGSETPTALTATFAYTNTTNWSVKLTGSGGPTWQPLPGLSVTPSDFSGSIAQQNGAWQWAITADIPSWTITQNVLTLTNTSLTLTDSCTSTTLVCPKADLFMLVGTTAGLTPPVGDSITIDADAVFGIGGGAGFSLYADVPNAINVAPGLSFTAPALAVSYALPAGTVTPTTGAPTFTGATQGGWSISTFGGLNVPGLGSFSQIATNITSAGITMGGWDADGVTLAAGNGSQSGTAFGYSSFASTMTADLPSFGTQTISLTPGQISVTGGFQGPQWFQSFVGATLPKAISTIQFNPTNGFFNAIVDVPGNYSVPAGGSQIQMPSLNFAISNNAQGLTVSAGGSANLSAAAVGGGTSSPPTMSVEMSYDFTTEQISASFGIENWNNAFGDQGLDINEAVLTLGAELASVPFPTPTIALYANLTTGSLPPDLTSAFGVSSGIPVVIGAELSEENPCIEVQVGSSTGTTPIMSVGGGSLQATYFEFVVAPLGCTLGNVNGTPIVIPPGFSMAFDGQLFGTEVDVQAAVSFDPTIFNASITVGAFSIPGTGGGMQFQQTTVTVSLNEATQIDSVAFSGGFSMFGTTIDVSGSLTYDGATETTSASLKVSQPQALNVAGFSLSNLSIALNVTYGPATKDLSIAASGAMDIMGNTVDVQAFDATIDNGVVEYVNVQIQASLNFGPVATADGTFDMSYTQSTDQFDLNAAVVLSTDAGFDIGTQANPATLEISPQCVAFSGSLQYAEFFTATLEGALVYQNGCAETVTNSAGQQVQGAPGDFSFSATNVAIGIAGFGATGDVALGYVGGDTYANFNATLALSPQSTNNEVTVAGAFNSNGNFSLTGTGNLDIAGFVLDMTVNASNQNGNTSIGGSADFNVGGTNLAFSGEFSMINGQPSTQLAASGNLGFDGFNLGSTTVTLNQTPGSFGMAASINLNAGLASLSGYLSFVANGGQPLFYVNVDGTLNLGALGGVTLGATFSNCTNSSCQQAAPTTLTMYGGIDVYGISYEFPSIPISAGGGFNITTGANGNGCTSPDDVAGVNWQACYSYTEFLEISSGAPYFEVSSQASANVQTQDWNPCKSWGQTGTMSGCVGICSISCSCYSDPIYGCIGGWDNWWTFIDVSGGIYFRADPFELSVDVSGITFTI